MTIKVITTNKAIETMATCKAQCGGCQGTGQRGCYTDAGDTTQRQTTTCGDCNGSGSC
jgi:hypothetical protein